MQEIRCIFKSFRRIQAKNNSPLAGAYRKRRLSKPSLAKDISLCCIGFLPFNISYKHEMKPFESVWTLRVMDQLEFDQRFMSQALGLAQAASAAGEVPVAALLVDPQSQKIIASAANTPIASHDPTAHAEICALSLAGQNIGNYRLNGLWLYVTLEPCAMCAGAIAHARIERLIFGASDPKGGAVISGTQFFEQPSCHWRPQVTGGIMAGESANLLKSFFRQRRS